MPGPFIHNIEPIYAKIGGFYLWFYGTSFTVGFLEVFYQKRISIFFEQSSGHRSKQKG